MKFLKLAVFALIVSAQAFAFAAPLVKIPSLRILTCEAMFHSGIENLAEPISILPSLRDIRYRMQRGAKLQADSKISYAIGSNYGWIKQNHPFEAQAIVRRMNGIERDLLQTNSDAQIVAFEFRGPRVIEAFDAMASLQEKLEREYVKARENAFDKWVRVTGPAIGYTFWALGAFLGYSAEESIRLAITDPSAFHFLTSAILGTGAVIYNGALGLGTLGRIGMQRDFDRESLGAFLKLHAVNPDEDEFFVGSRAINVPVRFHQMLMDYKATEEEKAIARERASLLSSVGNVAANLQSRVERTREDVKADIVANGGEFVRRVFIDHIVYTDNETKELVWLYVYRAFRSRPVPTSNGSGGGGERVEEVREEPNWLPGAARPVMLPIPVRR